MLVGSIVDMLIAVYFFVTSISLFQDPNLKELSSDDVAVGRIPFRSDKQVKVYNKSIPPVAFKAANCASFRFYLVFQSVLNLD